MSSRLALKKIFGSEMAQNDPNFSSYSIYRNKDLPELIDEDNSLVIINAARGSGKSGLLINLEKELFSNNNNIIIKQDYSDMVFPTGSISVNSSINYWKNTILSSVVAQIGSQRTWAYKDDDMAATELAEHLGIKDKNILSALLSRLKFQSNILEKCEFDPNIPIKQLSRIIFSSNRTFWILLDEMDDIYDNNDDLNLLIGLLQAVSFLSTNFQNVKIRLTIRPHIMTKLRTSNGTIQKLNEYEMIISWDAIQIIEILLRRLEFYEKKTNTPSDKIKLLQDNTENILSDKAKLLIEKYFDDFDMSFQRGSTSNYRAFGTLCFYRPRWLIEYCKEVRNQTKGESQSSIIEYKKAFLPFGNRRIQFITGEFQKTIPYIQAAIVALLQMNKWRFGKAKNLRKAIIQTILKPGIVKISDNTEMQNKALEIAKNLYIIEFIRGKEKIPGAGDHHRFYYYNDRPDLLSAWNYEPNVLWEIHPTYARAFNIVDNQTYKVNEKIKIAGEKNQHTL